MKISFVPAEAQNQQELLQLHVKPNQKNFVETVDQCLREAHEIHVWNPIGIYVDDVLVGFAMYGLWKNEGTSGKVWLDRFLIDEAYQGRGYAKPILNALIKRILKQYDCPCIYLSVYEDNQTAIRLYNRLGFEFNGELDIGGEKVMVLNFK